MSSHRFFSFLIFVLKEKGVFIGFITAEYSSMGINFSDLLNSFRIYIKNEPHIAVEDYNGNFMMVGLVNGADVSGGTVVTGAAMGDLSGYTLTLTGTDTSTVAFGAGGTVAYVANKLSVFASTTSAELAGVISDETGTGALVFASSPTLVTPVLGVATATSVASTSAVSFSVSSASFNETLSL